ncbi:MAG TPA: STAS domain-containing protein [Streptosporangiaceae bacterium]
MSELKSTISASVSGPVITLTGEADLSTAADLGELLNAQLEAEDTTLLTLDVSQLSFIDSMAVRLLIMGARVLRERGGTLVLRHPREDVARVLELMGVYQLITVQGRAHGDSGTDTS